MGCIGGAARLCKFDPEPGKITSPDWGAAVSPAGVYATETAISLWQRPGLEDDAGLQRRDDAGATRSPRTAPSGPATSSPGRTSAATTTSAGWATTCSAAAARPPRATANSPTATSGSRRAAARTSRPTRPTGRSSTCSAASTPTPAAPGARGPATAARSPTSRTRASRSSASYTNEGIPKTTGLFGGDPGSIMVTRVIQGSDLRDEVRRAARCRRTSTS